MSLRFSTLITSIQNAPMFLACWPDGGGPSKAQPAPRSGGGLRGQRCKLCHIATKFSQPNFVWITRFPVRRQGLKTAGIRLFLPKAFSHLGRNKQSFRLISELILFLTRVFFYRSLLLWKKLAHPVCAPKDRGAGQTRYDR